MHLPEALSIRPLRTVALNTQKLRVIDIRFTALGMSLNVINFGVFGGNLTATIGTFTTLVSE
jgi:hypothetical protein